ncbi:hypothetical protein FRC17_002358 [Serendipita sp. 399]|nr:hypothetical protein FRC17_002358 [Serendipita sp. 399]
MDATQNLPLPLRLALRQLETGLSNLTKCKYTTVAGLTVVLYDIVLLFSDDILVLRVLALYRATRTVTITLYALFFLSYGACLGITIDAAVFIEKAFYYDHIANVCNVGETPYIFKFIFLSPIFFELLIGGLTFWKCCQHAYAISHASAAPMIHIMLRDGLIWWTLVIGLRVWNAVIWMVLPHSLIYLGIYVHWALISAAVSRFFLNILDVGSHEKVDGFSTAYVTVRERERDAALQGMTLHGGDFVLDVRCETTKTYV